MKRIRNFFLSINRYLWQHKIILFPIAFAYLHILAISLLNGNTICVATCGMGIADVLYHDPIWHMALTAQAFNSLPFQMPVFSGANLQGYHFLADFLYFIIHKVGFSATVTYWKIMPHLFFFSFVYLAIHYARKLSTSVLFIFSYIFFLLLGGTFSFLPHFFHTGSFLGAGDMFLQMNSVILSPNVGFSFIIFLVVLLTVHKKTFNTQDTVILAACMFLQMGMKFYGGLTLFLFLNLYNLFFLFNKKTFIKFFAHSFLYAFAFGIAAIIFYDPFSVLKTSSVFIFSPFTLTHPLLEDPNLYHIKSMLLARYALLAQNTFSPRLILIETFTVGLFFFHYFGVFNIGLIYLLKQMWRKSIERLEIIYFLCALFTAFMVIFFTQKGYYSDTLQFLYYGMFFLAYFAAKTVVNIHKYLPKYAAYILIGLIFLSIFPNNLTDMQMPYTKQRIIPVQEIEALEFLRQQPAGAIATSQIDDSSYVPLFSLKQVYIADIQQLEITSLPYEKRRKEIEHIEKTNLKKLPVEYFYFLKSNPKYKRIIKNAKKYKLKKVFENSRTTVYAK